MEATNRKVIDSLWPPFLFVAVIWMIHGLQYIFSWDLGHWGIYPMAWFGLKGILTAPLIHADLAHLIHNSIPFFVLSSIMFHFYPKVALRSTVMIYILTGLAVWLFGRTVFHIGASGVVYGLMSFVIGTGIFRRNIKSVALAFIVFLLYSGMLVGLFPGKIGISWESHLYGALVGIFTAYFYKMEIESDEEKLRSEPLIAEANRSYFLPRDTFVMTRQERQQLEAEEAQRRLEEGL